MVKRVGSGEISPIMVSPPADESYRKRYCTDQQHAIGAVVIAALFAVMCIILIALLLFPFTKTVEIHDDLHNISYSQPYVTAAINLKLAMDTRYQPCRDFYNFACGAWGYFHPWPAGENISQYNANDELEDKIAEKIISTLEKSNFADFEPIQQALVVRVKKVFQACLDRNSTRNPARHLLTRYGKDSTPALKWPLKDEYVDKQSVEIESMETLLGEITFNYNVDTLFRVRTNLADMKNGLVTIGRIHNNIGLYFLFQSEMGAGIYRQLIMGVASLVLTEFSTVWTMDEIGRIADDIVLFEKLLIDLNVDSDNNANVGTQLTFSSVDNLSANFSNFNWTNYLKAVFPVYRIISVENSRTLKSFLDLWQGTSTIILKNVIGWRLMLANLPLFGGHYETIYNQFIFQTNGGYITDSKRRCIKQLLPFFLPEIETILEKVDPVKQGNVKEATNFVQRMQNATIAHLADLSDRMPPGAKMLLANFSQSVSIELGPDIDSMYIYDDLIDSELSKKYVEIVSSIRRLCRRQEGRQNKTFCEENPFLPFNSQFASIILKTREKEGSKKYVLRLTSGMLNAPYFEGEAPLPTTLAKLGTIVVEKIMALLIDQYIDYTDAPDHSTPDPPILNAEIIQKLKLKFEEQKFPRICQVAEKNRFVGVSNFCKSPNRQAVVAGIGLDIALRELLQSNKNASGGHATAFQRLPGLQYFDEEQIFFLSRMQPHCKSKNLPTSKSSKYFEKFIFESESRLNEILRNNERFNLVFSCK